MPVIRRAQVPPAVARYFGRPVTPQGRAAPAPHPTIAAVYSSGVGWRPYPGRKRINPTEARRLRREGVTDVCLTDGVRRADFRIRECCWPRTSERTRR